MNLQLEVLDEHGRTNVQHFQTKLSILNHHCPQISKYPVAVQFPSLVPESTVSVLTPGKKVTKTPQKPEKQS